MAFQIDKLYLEVKTPFEKRVKLRPILKLFERFIFLRSFVSNMIVIKVLIIIMYNSCGALFHCLIVLKFRTQFYNLNLWRLLIQSLVFLSFFEAKISFVCFGSYLICNSYFGEALRFCIKLDKCPQQYKSKILLNKLILVVFDLMHQH